MALKSTIHKAQLSIADTARHYYADHALTLALHPSETEERMMVRLLAFALNADERLSFGKGVSTDDEPALWLKDETDAIRLWIDVGLPDERRIRKACGRADAVHIYLYGALADKWWRDNEAAMRTLDKVSVYTLPDTSALKSLCQRNMQLQCTVTEDAIWLSDVSANAREADSFSLICQTLKTAN